MCNHSDKCKEAELSGKTIHVGRVFPLCHIKHSELEAIYHKYKGRVVFGGNQIRDEMGVLAVFQEQGASASSMTAAKLLDALSRMPGYDGQNADAFKAYTQASFKDFEGDTETWVELPRDRWPDSWFKDGPNELCQSTLGQSFACCAIYMATP